jgi:asparagine synthase (glutamine-hydrolysing)
LIGVCGLAGFVGVGNDAVLRDMISAVAHRGPDGEGVWRDPQLRVFLAHRRLSIVDIAGGAQPMWDSRGDVGVVYNGEIYNHLELRRELEAAGHRFRTSHSDTEVLVHGYREWGESLPQRLNGMFAFAIIDRPARRLFLARDRFGEKPLYYAHKAGTLVFGSEATTVLAHPLISREISARAIQKYFAWGFLPAPNAFYSDLRKLPGGSSLTYDIGTDNLKIHDYWRFHLEPDDRLTGNDEGRLAEELRERLADAVQRRLMSDAPLGIFLSGGIDSAAVLAAATRARPADTISTFTIGFTERSYDESGQARALAEAFGVRHHEEILDLEKARSALPGILRRLDEPLGDPSILPTYLLGAFATKHVKVALSGDGGDELFAGYDPFRALAPARLYSALVSRGVHRGLRRLADLLPRSNRNMSLDFKVRRALLGLSWPEALWNPVWLSPADPDLIAEIFDAPLSAEELYEEALDLWSTQEGDLIDKTLEFYTTFYLQDCILTKSDRATMLNSLEGRAVFLDNDLVDMCRRLPNRFKFRGGERKRLLRRAIADWVPGEVLKRKKKGFGIPLTRWLRDWQSPAVGTGAARTVGLRERALQERWGRHARGEVDERLLLFAWASAAPHLGSASA